MPFELVFEKVWEKPPAFIEINPAATTPVLDDNGTIVVESVVIAEYIEEIHPEMPLLGRSRIERNEIRRLETWFDRKFYDEIGRNLVYEKVLKRHFERSSTDSAAIRAGYNAISVHLSYISFLTDHRRWLAGDDFSLADITAAAHLSTVDYLGVIPWDQYPDAKAWYMRMKSRPSFKELLSDTWPGVPPSSHYRELDF